MDTSTKLSRIPGLFRSAWGMYKSRFTVSIAAGVGPVLFLSAGSLIAERGSPFLGFLCSLVGIVGYVLYVPALIHIFERGTSVRDAFAFALKNFFSYAWLAILTNLVFIGGFVMAVIPFFLFYVWFVLTPLIFVVEERRGMDALLASKAYVRGYFWPILGRLLLLIIAVSVIAGISSAFFASGQAVQNIGSLVLQLFLIPFFFAYLMTLYHDLRVIKPDISTHISNEKRGFFVFSAILGVLAPVIIVLVLGVGALLLLMQNLSAVNGA